MILYTINGYGEISGACDTYTSVVWATSYAGMGDFVLVCPASAKSVETFRRGARVARDADIKSDRIASQMIIWDVRTNYDAERGWVLTAYGKQLKSILQQRVIASYITSSGPIEATVRSVVSDNIVNPSNLSRRYAGLDLGPLLGIQTEQDIQATPGQNLGDWVEGTCMTLGLGWDVYTSRDDGRDKFVLTQGTDRSTAQGVNPAVILSPESDTLSAASISTITGSYGNVALVGGEGDGSDQVTVFTGAATSKNRHEIYIDGSSVTSDGGIITPEQYARMLKNYGRAELAKRGLVRHVEGTISDAGIYKYGTDYGLGDIVDITGGYIPLTRGRIIECTEAYDADGETMLVTLDTSL